MKTESVERRVSSVDGAATELCEMPTRLWRIPVGGRFYDFYGKQIFEKIGVCTVVKTRQTLHVLRCEQSPYTVLPGPITAAFFCAIGDVVFRGGNLLVFRFVETARGDARPTIEEGEAA